MIERQVSFSDFEEAYKQAEKEIPEKWYEKKLAYAGLGFGVLILSAWSRIFASGSSYAPNLAGGALYGLSAVADDVTTMEIASAQDKGAQNGFPRKFGEKNPDLSHVTASDYRSLWKKKFALDGLGLAVSSLFPEVGAGFAASKLTAAANNHRKATRYSRAVEIAMGK